MIKIVFFVVPGKLYCKYHKPAESDVATEKINCKAGNNNYKLDISNRHPGTFFIKLQGINTTYVEKLIKQ